MSSPQPVEYWFAPQGSRDLLADGGWTSILEALIHSDLKVGDRPACLVRLRPELRGQRLPTVYTPEVTMDVAGKVMDNAFLRLSDLSPPDLWVPSASTLSALISTERKPDSYVRVCAEAVRKTISETASEIAIRITRSNPDSSIKHYTQQVQRVTRYVIENVPNPETYIPTNLLRITP